jgi:hypothetical protein
LHKFKAAEPQNLCRASLWDILGAAHRDSTTINIDFGALHLLHCKIFFYKYDAALPLKKFVLRILFFHKKTKIRYRTNLDLGKWYIGLANWVAMRLGWI